jgi:hypothetical protein
MAQAQLNKVIALLEQGKVVFGGGMAWTGNSDEARPLPTWATTSSSSRRSMRAFICQGDGCPSSSYSIANRSPLPILS